MRLQWTLGAALLLATLAAGHQSRAAENQSGRLAALAARQDLCDMVCYAKADGHISQWERVLILAEAKSVLSQDEYLSFKRTLDRIAPPPPAKAKPKQKHLAKAVHKPAPKKKPAPVEKGHDLVIPASANLPDGVAQPVSFR
jgi:hypothetical protein